VENWLRRLACTINGGAASMQVVAQQLLTSPSQCREKKK